MKNTIENYFGLDFDKLNIFLIKYGANIIGSTPLSATIMERFENMDLDIWIRTPKYKEVTWISNPNYIESEKFIDAKIDDIPVKVFKFIQDLKTDKYHNCATVKNDFENLFPSYNFDYPFDEDNQNVKTDIRDYLDNKRFREIIHNIKAYKNKSGKKIQLIFITCNPSEVLHQFDLSFCATGWTGKKFITLEPELTGKKIGYWLNKEENSREEERKNKYLK